MVKAVNELDYKPKMIGGAMVGLQATVFKTQLGPLLNGSTNYETWVPSKMTPSADAFLKTYQSRAAAEGVDPLGYYLGTWGYAYLEVLAAGVNGTKSIDDDKIADWLRANPVKTIMGDIKFGAKRRMGEPRACCRCSITTSRATTSTSSGHGHADVLTPAGMKTGKLVYPYEKAKQ